MMLMLFRRWFVVTIGGIISGIDNVLLITLDLEVETDPDKDPVCDCGDIGMMAVMNSVVSLRASWLVHEVAVERVTKHPPGSTNFASGMDEVLLPELSLLMFTSIFFSITANPSRSETSSAIDRSSSLLSRIKLANDVTAATEGALVRYTFEFEFVVDVVSGTVSNSRSSVTVTPTRTLPLPFPSAFAYTFALVLLLFGDIVVGFGRTRMVSQRFDSDAATRENFCRFWF